MRPARTIVVLAMLALAAAGCKEDSNGPGTEPPVVSKLTCEDAETGTINECTLVLESASSFTVTLQSSSCIAEGNTVRIVAPFPLTLTENGCYIPAGQTWNFPVTWPAGTEVRMEVQSAPLELPTALRVTGAYPDWTLNFEDGGDTDYDDLILTVHAVE